jgi:hypothetical protein
MSVSIEIDVKDVINDIEKYSLEVQKNIKLEIATTGREVETTYKQNTPLVTARLKSSIHTEDFGFRTFVYNDNNGIAYDGSFKEKPSNDLTVFVGSNVKYARIIEQGYVGDVKVKEHIRVSKNGISHTVNAHSRTLNRTGNNALANAFDLHTSGLKDRINKILKP